MDDVFSSSVTAGMAAAGEAVSQQAEGRVAFAVGSPPIVGQQALGRIRGDAIVVRTCLDGDPSTEVGLVLADEAVFTLSALTLKLGVFPEELNEDVEAALGAIVTAFVAGWNESQRLPRMRWDARPEVRTVEVVAAGDLHGALAGRPTGLIGATMTVGVTDYPCALVGALGWMPAATRVAAPHEAPRPSPARTEGAPRPGASPPGEASSRGDDGPLEVDFPTPPPSPFAASAPAAPPPAPPPSAPGAREAPRRGAKVMIVDATGALSEWLSRQLESRAVALYRADAEALLAAGGATVLLVEADPDLYARLTPDRAVVLRRA